MRIRPVLLPAALAVCAGAAAVLSERSAVADGTTCSAFLSGGEAGPKVASELVVFNTTDVTVTLDLRIRDAAGGLLVERLGGLELGPQETEIVDLQTELERDLPPRTKPYVGLYSAELAGPAPFGPSDFVVHLAQYHGKRKRPKAAFVLRPLFRE